MTTPRDDIAGLSERLREHPTQTHIRALIDEAATQLDSLLKERDALQARVKELEANQERLWCTACGTVTRDQICDCNRWPHMTEAGHKPNFVNYADAMATDARLATLDVARLQQEHDEAYERAIDLVENGLFIEAQDTEWDLGVNFAKKVVIEELRRLASGPEKEG